MICPLSTEFFNLYKQLSIQSSFTSTVNFSAGGYNDLSRHLKVYAEIGKVHLQNIRNKLYKQCMILSIKWCTHILRNIDAFFIILGKIIHHKLSMCLCEVADILHIL